MGQCNTLPAEARNQEPQQGDRMHLVTNAQHQRDYRMQESNPASEKSSTLSRRGRYRRGNSNNVLQVTVPRNEDKRRPPVHQPPPPPQPQQYQSRETSQSVQPMQEDVREAAPSHETAKRTRCYKLNLDSDLVGMTGDIRVEGNLLGPYTEPPPQLTYSNSEDSSTQTDPTAVAIRTAQIFRGIKVSKDGTILSQNARATRSSRGSKVKRGEKSRQATKIEQAKDLVEESVVTGKAPGTNDPAHLVSLYIMGEYDEMKYLVRDGSKKLREASSLPDDALLSINRSRTNSFRTPSLANSSSRKRVSPSGNSSSDPFGSPQLHQEQVQSRLPPIPQSAPPKLKGHPRDMPRREEGRRRGGFLPMQDSCFGPPHGGMGESDWGEALGFNSIWNCGSANASGTTSPIQVVTKEKEYHHSPSRHHPQQQQRVYEGRNETSYSGRHDPSNMTARA